MLIQSVHLEWIDLSITNGIPILDGLLDAMQFFQLPHGLILTYNQYDKVIIEDKTIEVLPAFEYFKNEKN